VRVGFWYAGLVCSPDVLAVGFVGLVVALSLGGDKSGGSAGKIDKPKEFSNGMSRSSGGYLAQTPLTDGTCSPTELSASTVRSLSASRKTLYPGCCACRVRET